MWFALSRDGGYQFRNSGQIAVLKEADWTSTASTVDAAMTFSTMLNENLTEKGRFDSAGSLFVGKPASDNTAVGIQLVGTQGQINSVTTDAGGAQQNIFLNRQDSDGTHILFRKSNGTVGLIGTNSGGLFIGQGDTTLSFSATADIMLPTGTNGATRDNAVGLGNSSNRFDDAFITNGVTTGSDRTEKQDIAALTSAEMLVAARISQTFHTYRWKDAVADKGDNARIHTGTIAQEVQAAFTAEGLDASRYAMFMSDTWWGHDVAVAAVEANEEKNIDAADAYTHNVHYYTEDEAPEGSIKKTRLGIRYPELLSFLAAYNEQRFAAIETRLTALEG